VQGGEPGCWVVEGPGGVGGLFCFVLFVSRGGRMVVFICLFTGGEEGGNTIGV